ncbi:hypothetical protein AMATHDRAFT_143112 [Amanita thiersii Skay4041]|uniref:Uncharacterized protein n=1 Tax=Amanita thiersii Skay4041 TaxID=703135 RepID=A0A2A9NU31_9AGAR|nr:hypothetical protein AMATHDRAFT_143112 [Amanita thiersii Skay4041]
MIPSESFQPMQLKGEIMDLEFTLDTDHRKRRRNRTTQSCLNCHTSKRKTGLCVYEIDDPALRDDPTLDETTRLRNRIAELESLVRELRGKPHPKWAENNFRDGDPTEKWHSRAAKCAPLTKRGAQHSDDNSHGSRVAPTLLSPIKTEPVSDSPGQLYRFSPSPGPAMHYHTFQPEGRGTTTSSSYENGQRHSFGVNSTGSGQYHGQVHGVHYNGSDHNSSSGASSHHDAGEYSIDRNGNHDGRSYDNQYNHGYCPCRSSPTTGVAYISLLQQIKSSLSSIRQYTHHPSNTQCLLYRRIMELNSLMQGCDLSDSSHSYESHTPSEVMSPISVSSGQTSYHTGSPQAVSPQEWNNLTAAGYNPYFPMTSGDHTMYSHVLS